MTEYQRGFNDGFILGKISKGIIISGSGGGGGESDVLRIARSTFTKEVLDSSIDGIKTAVGSLFGQIAEWLVGLGYGFDSYSGDIETIGDGIYFTDSIVYNLKFKQNYNLKLSVGTYSDVFMVVGFTHFVNSQFGWLSNTSIYENWTSGITFNCIAAEINGNVFVAFGSDEKMPALSSVAIYKCDDKKYYCSAKNNSEDSGYLVISSSNTTDGETLGLTVERGNTTTAGLTEITIDGSVADSLFKVTGDFTEGETYKIGERNYLYLGNNTLFGK